MFVQECWRDAFASLVLLQLPCANLQFLCQFCYGMFGNGNVMSKSRPVAELNTKALVCAVTVMKIFFDQINFHQATMAPITVMPGIVAAYTVSPWNNTQARGTKKDDKNSSLADGASCSKSNHNFNIKKHRGDKRIPATPDESDE
jgi:hypothetical protein